MTRTEHIPESDLALFISGDVSMWSYLRINLHIARCESCRLRIDAYRDSRQRLKHAAAELPEGADWDRLAAEMTANIRVGLAAGECVAPRRGKLDLGRSFKPAALMNGAWPSKGWPNGWPAGWKAVAAWSAVFAGVAAVLSAAWLLNLGASDGDSLSRSMHALFQGNVRSGPLFPGVSRPSTGRAASNLYERGPVFEASADGVELKKNDIAVSTPQANTRPVAITVSAESASALYVDEDTGQVTIAGVYAQ